MNLLRGTQMSCLFLLMNQVNLIQPLPKRVDNLRCPENLGKVSYTFIRVRTEMHVF